MVRYNEKENKIFFSCCRESQNGKNINYSLQIGTNNFQTDSLQEHEASEGHAMSLQAKRARFEAEGKKTNACSID